MKITHRGDPEVKFKTLVPTKEEWIEAMYQEFIGNAAPMAAMKDRVDKVAKKFPGRGAPPAPVPKKVK